MTEFLIHRWTHRIEKPDHGIDMWVRKFLLLALVLVLMNGCNVVTAGNCIPSIVQPVKTVHVTLSGNSVTRSSGWNRLKKIAAGSGAVTSGG